MSSGASTREGSLILATLYSIESLKASSKLPGYVLYATIHLRRRVFIKWNCMVCIYFFVMLNLLIISWQIGAIQAVSREAYFTAVESELLFFKKHEHLVKNDIPNSFVSTKSYINR